ncbi:MAG: periplasmic heavy metal sensor, partial [Pseudomonadota bacterium]|nr:periplasmic heavy metal sensor [Pseudomonadota bacterium]
VPKGVREKARPILREHSREVIAARRDVRQSERALRKLLQSENLTRDELEAGLAEMRRSTADYHELIHEVGIDVLLSLDPKQRMKAAPYLFKQPGRQRSARQGGQDGEGMRPQRPPVQED